MRLLTRAGAISAGASCVLAVLGTGAGAAPVSAAAKMPIDHVVVLMQENRSFDSYFGQIHFQGQPRAGAEPRDASNPNPVNEDAPAIRAFHQQALCEVADLNHSWTGVHQQINGDDMNGFTATNVDPADPTGSRAMGFYNQSDLPFY
jgi:phospholipase C